MISIRSIVVLLLHQVATAEFLGASTLAPARNESGTQNCQQTCAELAQIFGPALHYPGADNFTIWDAKQQEVRPACRVEPTTADEVAKVMSVLVRTWCRFAVKGGGHSRNPDDSNSVGGVTVDLNRINGVEISPDATTARIGGGANSYQVYSALDPKNLSFVGGRVDSVGVGGFTLGGGTSPLSAKYGWALDSVHEYEVVLPNSSIVIASEQQNPDLYFSLRGGGSNFGIVTSFVSRIFPQGPVFGATRVFSDNRTDEVLEQAYQLYTASNDTNMNFWYYYSYSQSEDRFTIVGTERYAEPVMDPPVFHAVNSIPFETASASIDSLGNFSVRGPITGRDRHVFATLTYFPSRALNRRAIDIFKEEVQEIRNATGLATQVINYPIQQTVLRGMRERGGNAIGLDVPGPLFLTLLSTTYASADDDARINAFADRFLERAKAAAVELGVFHPYIYMNYAKADQDVFSGYAEENVARLREIQKSIDPLGVFTSKGLCQGYFKLF